MAAFEGHSDHIGALAFSPDGRHLASASTDGTVRMRDTEYNAEYQKLPHGAEVSTVAVSFAPDTALLSVARESVRVDVRRIA